MAENTIRFLFSDGAEKTLLIAKARFFILSADAAEGDAHRPKNFTTCEMQLSIVKIHKIICVICIPKLVDKYYSL